MNVNANIEDVRKFWNSNPLWTGESRLTPGTEEFFKEHRQIIIDDCFAGELDLKTLPVPAQRRKVLDLGCGIGFWTIELALLNCTELHSADLTSQALDLTKKRLHYYKLDSKLHNENAEKLSFSTGTYSHVNCQGVIHHTPNTESCVAEIARVLEQNGTASISVYYKNVFLKLWPILRIFGLLFSYMGARLKGRGREHIFRLKNVNEIVRFYDGSENPIGKAYSKEMFIQMLEPHFVVKETYLHFFPARSLPFKINKRLHGFLDKHFGFMIYATVVKK